MKQLLIKALRQPTTIHVDPVHVLHSYMYMYMYMYMYTLRRIWHLVIVVYYVHVNILLAHDPLSSSGYPMITYTHPVADNFL